MTATTKTQGSSATSSADACPSCGKFSGNGALCQRCIDRGRMRESWRQSGSAQRVAWVGQFGVGELFCRGGQVPTLDDDGLAERIETNPLPKGGLLISGVAGAHKTHLACARVVCAISRGYSAALVKWADFALQVRDTYKPAARESERDVLMRYAELDHLCIDDIGIGRGDAAESDHAIRLAYLLLDRRYDTCKTTDITTNLTPDELHSRFDDRIARRIGELCTTYVMKLRA